MNISLKVIVPLALVAACLGAGCRASKVGEVANRPRHVVFVGLDGLAAWCVKAHPEAMPTLAKMRAEGASTLTSRSILPSSSACNWHSIFTCSASEQHGFNDWDSKKPVFAPAATLKSGLYPDVYAVLREQRPSAKSAYFYEWSGMAFVIDTNACSFVERAPAAKLGALAVKSILEKKPDFLSVAYDQPDGAGHGKGWGSPEYVDGMKKLDADLAAILKAIEDASIADETVVVVSSDHGGVEKRHGGASLQEMERPLVIWGKGVKRGYAIPDATTVYDTGATLAALLGLDFPQAWIGRPVLSAFED